MVTDGGMVCMRDHMVRAGWPFHEIIIICSVYIQIDHLEQHKSGIGQSSVTDLVKSAGTQLKDLWSDPIFIINLCKPIHRVRVLYENLRESGVCGEGEFFDLPFIQLLGAYFNEYWKCLWDLWK